jgi:hypothetical protein
VTLKREHGDAAIKIICAVIPAIGTYFAITNQTTAIIVSVVQAAAVFLGFHFVSKITVPESFALGYFSSFLDPSAYAANNEGFVRYTDKGGQSIDKDLKSSNARLLVVMPEDLDVGNNDKPLGPSEVLKQVQKDCIPGALHFNKTGKDKTWGVYLDVTNTQELLIVDMPNNLFPLSKFALREFGNYSDVDSRAKKVLAEYGDMLGKFISENANRLKARVTTIPASRFIAGQRS